MGSTGVVILSLSVQLPQKDRPLVFYSNQHAQDLKRVICSALHQAKSSIYIQIYGFTDPDLLELLKQKSTEGVAITIFHDKTASKNLKNDLKGFAQTYPVQCAGLMHRKIFIIDNEQVFIGTANFTYQSLKMHDNLLIGLHHAELSRFIKKCSPNYYPFQLNEQALELFLLPDFDKSALPTLIQLIENATSKIQIAMFTLTHPELTEKLIEAARRGVEVQIAVDFYAGQGASRKILEKMMQENISILLSRGEQLLHYKWANIDDKYLVAGSANWTRAAFEKNQDCFLTLHPLNKIQIDFLHHLWKCISYGCDQPG